MANLNLKPELPSPWIEQWSEHHQTPYYINTSSNESTWTAPQIAPPAYESSEPAGPPPLKATDIPSNLVSNTRHLPSLSSPHPSSDTGPLGAERPSPNASSFSNTISRLTNHTPNQQWHSSQSLPLPTSQSGLSGRLSGLLNRVSGGGSSWQDSQEWRRGESTGGSDRDSYVRGDRDGHWTGSREKQEIIAARRGRGTVDTGIRDASSSSSITPPSFSQSPLTFGSAQQPITTSSSSQFTVDGLGQVLQSTRIGGRLQQHGGRAMNIPSRIEGRAPGMERSDKGQRKWEKMERKEERRERKEERKDRKAKRKAIKRGYL